MQACPPTVPCWEHRQRQSSEWLAASWWEPCQSERTLSLPHSIPLPSSVPVSLGLVHCFSLPLLFSFALRATLYLSPFYTCLFLSLSFAHKQKVFHFLRHSFQWFIFSNYISVLVKAILDLKLIPRTEQEYLELGNHLSAQGNHSHHWAIDHSQVIGGKRAENPVETQVENIKLPPKA